MTTTFAVTKTSQGALGGNCRYVNLEVVLEDPNPAAENTIDLSAAAYGEFSTVYGIEAPMYCQKIGPGYLTGGDATETTIATWNAVTDGYFKLNIDGAGVTEYGPCDFSAASVTTMAHVVAIIDAALGTSADASWVGGLLIIKSANTGITSSMSKATAGTSGTDISGAGAGTFMDCDAGATGEAITINELGYVVQAMVAGTTATIWVLNNDYSGADGPMQDIGNVAIGDNNTICLRVLGN